jgi:D-alanyl-lipoteichoic acid acyltransferase DltB (MBOAT superfamily)
MLFSSYKFVFVFLPLTMLAFMLARLYSARAGVVVLAVASLIFYASWKRIYLVLLVGSLVANFCLGWQMARSRRPRAWAILGIAANLLVLGYFKYATFILDNLHYLAGIHLVIGTIVLPIGISFFTFQQIAYLADVERGVPAERDPLSFAMFVSFFPHLIAGPLVHHAEMIPQFKNAMRKRFVVLVPRGVAIAIAGLFKKAVLADSFAQFATPAFAHVDAGGAIAPHWAWTATLAYALQIYFDFSGYSDMAIGLALMFGIRLPVNFRSPYKACSIIDFWRRWHITLSRFLRDYLYIPLGGNRRGRPRRYLNLMITMLLGGLWHGAGWNFVVWGAIHGICLAANNAWREMRRSKGRALALLDRVPQPVRRRLGWIATFAVVLVAWVFFRATTMAGAATLLTALFGLAGRTGGVPYAPPDTLHFAGLPWALPADARLIVAIAVIAGGLVVATTLPNTAELFRYREYRRAPEAKPAPWQWQPSAPWALAIALAFTLSILAMAQSLEFLYFQF